MFNRYWILLAVVLSTLTIEGQKASPSRDSPMPDITIPQVQAQVVSSADYFRLGSQDRAIYDIDKQLAELNVSVSSIKIDVKSLQETDVRINLLMNIGKYVVSIILTSGLLAWFFHYLKERKRPGNVQAGSVKLE